MRISRDTMANPRYWLTAGQVVDASLEGLRKGRLFVIPGWHYRLIVALITKLPVRLRLAIEARVARR
jgi:short-subunit dehydrogenase